MKDYNIQQVLFVSDKLKAECAGLAGDSAANIAEAEEVKNNIQKDVNQNAHWLFTYTAQEELRGFVKGHPEQYPRYVEDLPEGPSCEMEWLYVDKKYQRQGIGAGLIKAYKDHARSQNMASLFGYLSNSKPLKKFFKKFGFETIGWHHLIGKSLVK
ncbi:MAG: GNAT family N-acetyltransferase [Rickettsiales bacterium]|jgi:GNAT superfamily N-acetyltransferase|nr:GNAT family N-acetyltransferase [Rickettsiales bacterium]